MLMLQALGLWHAVVHAHGMGQVALPVSHVDAHDGEHDGEHDGDFAGHDDGDVQCRLYDQLAHADLVFGEAPAFVPTRSTGTLEGATPAGRLAPQAAGFLARGPPLTA